MICKPGAVLGWNDRQGVRGQLEQSKSNPPGKLRVADLLRVDEEAERSVNVR